MKTIEGARAITRGRAHAQRTKDQLHGQYYDANHGAPQKDKGATRLGAIMGSPRALSAAHISHIFGQKAKGGNEAAGDAGGVSNSEMVQSVKEMGAKLERIDELFGKLEAIEKLLQEQHR